MDVTLCNNGSEVAIINKNITDIDQATATIKGDLSVEAPVLILAYDSNADDINYIKIPDLHRNYFISDIINLTGGRYEVHCKVDVLESFKDQILSLTAIVDKTVLTTLANQFIDDGSFVCENKEFNTVINFPNGFNENGEYILITAGGGGGII